MHTAGQTDETAARARDRDRVALVADAWEVLNNYGRDDRNKHGTGRTDG